jgi:hypothetical protein
VLALLLLPLWESVAGAGDRSRDHSLVQRCVNAFRVDQGQKLVQISVLRSRRPFLRAKSYSEFGLNLRKAVLSQIEGDVIPRPVGQILGRAEVSFRGLYAGVAQS